MTSISTSVVLSTTSHAASAAGQGGTFLIIIVIGVVAFGALTLLGRLLAEAVSMVASLAAAGARLATIAIVAVAAAVALLLGAWGGDPAPASTTGAEPALVVEPAPPAEPPG